MGAFTQWPYTNTHELNLDWVLEQLKNAASKTDIEEIRADLEQLRTDLENYITDPATLQAIADAVNAYLDELVQQGILSDLIYRTMKETIMDLTYKDAKTYTTGGNDIVNTFTLAENDIDNITLQGLTLRQIFEYNGLGVQNKSNLINCAPMDQGSFPELGSTSFSPNSTRCKMSVNQTFVHDYSVNVNTTSGPAYMSGPSISLDPDDVWFVGCKYYINADRAGYNNATGFRNMPFAQSSSGTGMIDGQVNVRWLPREMTYKWLTYAAVGSYEGSAASLPAEFGTFENSGNYVGLFADCFTLINMSATFSSLPDYAEMKLAFNIYLGILKNNSSVNQAVNGQLVPAIDSECTPYQYMTLFYRKMSYKAMEINMVPGWKQFYSASGWNDQEANSNKFTTTQLLKLGMAYAADSRINKYASTRDIRINCFGNRAFSKHLTNEYISNGHSYMTNAPVLGKGGSLPAPASGLVNSARIRDIFCLIPIRPSSYHREVLMAVAIMGLDADNDNRWNLLVDCANIGNDLANGNTPSPSAATTTLMTRSDNPVNIALMICDRPLEFYTSETWTELTSNNRTLHWESTDADTTEYIAASTSKMLTALTAIDMIRDIHEMNECDTYDIQPGSGNCILPSDTVDYETLFYLALMNSDNDASNMLARCSMRDYYRRIYSR